MCMMDWATLHMQSWLFLVHACMYAFVLVVELLQASGVHPPCSSYPTTTSRLLQYAHDWWGMFVISVKDVSVNVAHRSRRLGECNHD